MKRSLFILLLLIGYCTSEVVVDGVDVTIPLTDTEVVMSAYKGLTNVNITYTGSDTQSSVTSNLSVPLIGYGSTTISWSSSKSNLSVSGASVTTTRPLFGSGNQSVTLTAVLVKGDVSLDKQFVLTILEVTPISGNIVDYLITASFRMVYVKAGSFKTGTDDLGTATISKDYLIGDREITYLQWTEVKVWADANGYTLSNVGTMGDGIGDNNQHPVTTINWRDAMVWTNALTEYYNAQKGTTYKCVYTSDTTFNNCLKVSSNGALDLTVGSIDNPYVNPDAKGFRLLTKDEWGYASRYISDSNSDGDISDSGEYNPGDHASGDISASYLTSSDIGDYAWYDVNSGNSTNTVGVKTANALGLFDMTGNVFEWTYDWDINNLNTFRVYRGGSWNLTIVNLQLGKIYFDSPNAESAVVGFRLGRNY